MQTDIQEFTVRDRLGLLTVKGQMLADCRYGRSDKPRWTDMALYRIEPGSETRSTDDLERDLLHRLTWEMSHDGVIAELPDTMKSAVEGAMSRTLSSVAQEQPPYRYLLEFVARSFVYHRIGGPCARQKHRTSYVGAVKKNAHRWRWLVPCPKAHCQPPELEAMSDADQIAEERDKHHLYLCTDAADIVNQLYRRSGEISQLAATLLFKASGNDPEIRDAWKNGRRV